MNFLNRDGLIVGICIAIAVMLYFYFDTRQRETNLQPIKASIIANQRPCVLHFYADWCGACRYFDPILKDTLRPYGPTIDCRNFNIDKSGNYGFLCHTFGSSGIPTTIIFDRQGNQITKIVGAMEAQELDKWLQKAVRAH